MLKVDVHNVCDLELWEYLLLPTRRKKQYPELPQKETLGSADLWWGQEG